VVLAISIDWEGIVAIAVAVTGVLAAIKGVRELAAYRAGRWMRGHGKTEQATPSHSRGQGTPGTPPRRGGLTAWRQARAFQRLMRAYDYAVRAVKEWERIAAAIASPDPPSGFQGRYDAPKAVVTLHEAADAVDRHFLLNPQSVNLPDRRRAASSARLKR
jgi:hypothetical protein